MMYDASDDDQERPRGSRCPKPLARAPLTLLIYFSLGVPRHYNESELAPLFFFFPPSPPQSCQKSQI